MYISGSLNHSFVLGNGVYVIIVMLETMQTCVELLYVGPRGVAHT